MTRKDTSDNFADPAASPAPALHQQARHSQIKHQLGKILSNPEFYATELQKSFLEFVVRESLAGRSEQLKGYTVATQVFARADDFDPQIDPIVSVQANRLRRALEHYYLVYGTNDPIVIDIPKGTYVPVFIERKLVPADDGTTADHTDADNLEKWPTLTILPFNNRTGDPDNGFLCIGLAAELASEIAYFQNMNVVFPREGGDEEACHQPESRFVLSGDLYKTHNKMNMSIHLEDTKSGHHVWGDVYRGELDVLELTQFLDNMVKIVASKVSGDFGVISRLISTEKRHVATTKLSTYEAILRFYEWERNSSPQSFKRSMEALSIAVQNDPDCGRIWSLLGLQYAGIHNLGITGFEKPLQKATEYAERGALLEPNCQRAIGSLAYIRFCNNELAIAIDEVDRALNLNPNSLFVLDGLAYILILSGDWNRGVEIAEKVIKVNPYHRTILHDALWVNYLRAGKDNHAYHEAMYCRRPWLFWDPLIKGSTLGLLDQETEGRTYAGKLLELRPDFAAKGRELIRNYIKFEAIAERIEHGLKRVGIGLD